MNNSFAVNDRFEITPRSGGIPLAAFVGGIAFFIFLLLAIYFNSLYFIPAACLLLPLLYLNKTATLYVYVLVYAYALPIYSYQGDLRLDDLLFIVLVSTWLMDKMLNPCAESQKKPFTRPLILWL
ncbi:hypothetical protein AMJ80_02595 [bacterium SM23_31]|nr:MAG: hypothetical protein AMJ80_02595 [bacterium SM23_31]